MKVSTKYDFNLRRDSVTSLETAGVLGETYLDIDSSQAVGPLAQDGDTLPTHVHPDFNEVVRSSQSTLQNMDALLKRADRILAFAESGKGSLGKLIYDPTLYDRFSQTVAELKDGCRRDRHRTRQPGPVDQSAMTPTTSSSPRSTR